MTPMDIAWGIVLGGLILGGIGIVLLIILGWLSDL